MTVRFCCRCGAKTGVLGLCSMNPNHATDPTTDEGLVCGCGSIKRLDDPCCGECYFSDATDSPLVERD